MPEKKSLITDNELRERNIELERENAELRNANEILKEALAIVAEKRKNKGQM